MECTSERIIVRIKTDMRAPSLDTTLQLFLGFAIGIGIALPFKDIVMAAKTVQNSKVQDSWTEADLK